MCKEPQVLIFKSSADEPAAEERHYYFEGTSFVCTRCKKSFGTVWDQEYPQKEYMEVTEKLAKKYGGKYFDVFRDDKVCKNCAIEMAWGNLRKMSKNPQASAQIYADGNNHF
jgi:hypothetical protein